MLNSYFQNAYKKAKMNKFHYFSFINTYDPKHLRFHFALSLGITSIASVALALVHPFLPLLLAYDYYLLLGFTKVLNQTTFVLVLDQGKRHVYLNRLNSLGYMKKFEEKKISLRSIKYIGEYRNEYVTLDHKGLLPSISRLMNMSSSGSSKMQNDLNSKIGNNNDAKKKEETSAEQTYDKLILSTFGSSWQTMRPISFPMIMSYSSLESLINNCSLI
jgi:hypothetical protein